MAHTIHDIGVASQIGSYSDAIEAKPNLRWLMTSGTPGLTVNGDGLPKDITGQAELAWQHIIGILGKAGMTVTDIVKVTQYLTRADDIAGYDESSHALSRSGALGGDVAGHPTTRLARDPRRGRIIAAKA